MSRLTLLCSTLVLSIAPAAAQFHVHLSPETNTAFDQYLSSAETSMDFTARFTASTKSGEIRIAPLGKDGLTAVANGLIHDWSASTVAPGMSVEKVLGVLQNYQAYKTVYA